jgi:hypothetical protein
VFTSLFVIASVVVVVAWWLGRRRLHGSVQGPDPVVSDELLGEILAGDELESPDEPLDEDEIRKAKDRFWEGDEWEEPEEYEA